MKKIYFPVSVTIVLVGLIIYEIFIARAILAIHWVIWVLALITAISKIKWLIGKEIPIKPFVILIEFILILGLISPWNLFALPASVEITYNFIKDQISGKSKIYCGGCNKEEMNCERCVLEIKASRAEEFSHLKKCPDFKIVPDEGFSGSYISLDPCDHDNTKNCYCCDCLSNFFSSACEKCYVGNMVYCEEATGKCESGW